MGNFLTISLTIASSGPLTLLSLSFALACNQVHCDLCVATFLNKLQIPFLFKNVQFCFPVLLWFLPGQCTTLHNAFAVLFAILFCLR